QDQTTTQEPEREMRILIAQCTQEVSSFNPLESEYTDFRVERGNSLSRQRGMNTHLGGALAVFDTRPDVDLVWTISTSATSTGPLSAKGWKQLREEVLAEILPHAGKVDAIYYAMHGAMGAVDEPDPEGSLLETVREAFGDI